MTETELRTALAKKLGWKYRDPRPPWVGYWIDPIGNPSEPPSLYDLCLEGEERLTKEQREAYGVRLCLELTGSYPDDYCAFDGELVIVFATAPLEVRARALIEVLP